MSDSLNPNIVLEFSTVFIFISGAFVGRFHQFFQLYVLRGENGWGKQILELVICFYQVVIWWSFISVFSLEKCVDMHCPLYQANLFIPSNLYFFWYVKICESKCFVEGLIFPCLQDIWNKTWYPKAADHVNTDKPWYVVDATDLILGRLASTIAVHIRGKTLATYTPSVDMGAFVIVVCTFIHTCFSSTVLSFYNARLNLVITSILHFILKLEIFDLVSFNPFVALF